MEILHIAPPTPTTTQQPPPKGWRARKSPTHRLGLFTTRPFLHGEVILSEPALAHYDSDGPLKVCVHDQGQCQEADTVDLSTSPYRSLRQTMEMFIPAHEILTLEMMAGTDRGKVLFEKLVLAMEHGGLPVEDGAVLVEGAYYLNHSCTPNAFAVWDRDHDRFTVRIDAAIPAGTEITVSYINPYLQLPQREKELGFKCECQHCIAERQNPDSYFGRLDGLWPAVERLRAFLLRHNTAEFAFMYAATDFILSNSHSEKLEILHGLGADAQTVWTVSARLLGAKHVVVTYFLQRAMDIATQLKQNGYPGSLIDLCLTRSTNEQFLV
ncbi:SET domain-containing protein 5 [Recurvomyces mirabilis]|nr:SET domain-containing protein 5 [Recurvomyces mirabilis]